MSNAALNLTSAPIRRTYLTLMTDDSERRPTDLAPPPSDKRDTQPPGADDVEATRAMHTMLPGAPPSPYQSPPTWWEGSFFQSVFNDVQQSLRSNAEILEGQNAILAAVQQADRNNQSGWETTQAQISSFRTELQLNGTEVRAVRAELERLKVEMQRQADVQLAQAKQIALLEELLERRESNESAQATAPTG